MADAPAAGPGRGEADWSAVRLWHTRGKKKDRDDLVAMELIRAVGRARVRITKLGRLAQELGEAEFDVFRKIRPGG